MIFQKDLNVISNERMHFYIDSTFAPIFYLFLKSSELKKLIT